MNQAELLDQFVLEARECLEAIGQRLLDVERQPGDAALLNDLFRSVHTLKGNCGLFEFKALERVVHAGEDLLDSIRHGHMAYTDQIADALLEAMDYTAERIDEIEREGRIAEAATARSMQLADALRSLLACDGPATSPADARPAIASHATHATAPEAATPPWLARLPDAQTAHAGATAVHYTPEPECFFKGEDPWRLVCTAPGLQAFHIAHQGEGWPAAHARQTWDCYRCELDVVLISDAPRAYLEDHFRCVPEQLQWHDIADMRPSAPAASLSPADTIIASRTGEIWQAQCTLLGREPCSPGVVQAVSRTLIGLLKASGAETPDNVPADRQALLAWAQGAQTLSATATGGDGSDDTAAGALQGDAQTDAPTDVPGEGPALANAGGNTPQSRVLKVGQEKIDRLMDLIGEMVVAKNSLPYLAERAENVFSQRDLAREIKAQYAVINRIAEDMQHAIMQVRMLPVGTIFQRFGRLVRDISRKLGKDVQLIIEGEDTEADKNVIEALADPLIHILRNSLDHGIELPAQRVQAGKPAQGTIRIHAHQQSDRVLIDISDDGAGVHPQRVRDKAVERGLIPADRAGSLSDEECVQLIFLAGFSTAESVSDLSGRGVGMDVVRTAVERIGGSVALSSKVGQGTHLSLSLPLSMAVTNVMMIESGGRRFGVPMDLIVETVRVHAEDIHSFKQARTTVLRGRIVPLRSLGELLDLGEPDQLNEEGEHAVLVVRLGSENVGLIVDRFHGASDIILKPLEGVLAGLTGFAGTALMGDGSVLMVLNPKELI